MADIALGSVPRIINIALKIKEAAKNVKQNEKECRDIGRCVARVTALIKRLDEVTEAMEEEVMRDALEDLAESLESALELVTKCQRKHAIRRFIGAGDMAKELRLVQDDILRKVTIGSFATNIVQLTVTLTIAQAAPAPQRRQQGVGTEKPSHDGHRIIGDAGDGRYETDQTNELATGSGAQSVPLSGLKKFSLSELQVATQNFSDENKIGRGGFSDIFKGLLRSGTMAAIKKLHVNRSPNHVRAMLLNEMNIGAKLQHKNVVKTLGYCDDKEMKSIEFEGKEIDALLAHCILVIAYLPNGTLADMDPLSRTQRMYWPFYFRIIQQIAQGLHYIHEQNVVHLDIKPGNILFDSDMNPVIFDFGISTVLDNEDYIYTENIIGTPGYIAPELIDKSIVSKKNDVFGFGVLVLDTVLGRTSWRNLDLMEEGAEKMMDLLDTTFVEESELPEVERCLEVALLCRDIDPANRPTMAEVVDMLNGKIDVPARKNKRSEE